MTVVPTRGRRIRSDLKIAGLSSKYTSVEHIPQSD
jgi:hypothetical protein